MALANQLGLTTKVVSERHHYASMNKMTAGEAAKKLSKLLKKKILAADVKPHCTEWHHSGFYSGGGGKKVMGRTWFVSDELFKKLLEIFKDNGNGQ